jgi:hypothetical protein
MTAAIVITLVILVGAGSAAVIALSARLRTEIQDLLAAFGRTEPALIPIVDTVRRDRERLAQRLAELSGGRSEPDLPRR